MAFCDEWVLKLKWFGAMRTIGPEKTDTCVREIGAKEIQDFGRSTDPIFGATGDSSMDPDLQEACSTRIHWSMGLALAQEISLRGERISGRQHR